jgi:pantothenate kinase type III
VEEVEAVAVACVVPPLESVLDSVARRYLSVPPLFVAPGIKTGMPILVENPSEVGADRNRQRRGRLRALPESGHRRGLRDRHHL